MSARLLGLALLVASLGAPFRAGGDGDAPVAPDGRGFLAVSAGTIQLVEEGRVLHDGTLLIKDGVIQALGEGRGPARRHAHRLRPGRRDRARARGGLQLLRARHTGRAHGRPLALGPRRLRHLPRLRRRALWRRHERLHHAGREPPDRRHGRDGQARRQARRGARARGGRRDPRRDRRQRARDAGLLGAAHPRDGRRRARLHEAPAPAHDHGRDRGAGGAPRRRRAPRRSGLPSRVRPARRHRAGEGARGQGPAAPERRRGPGDPRPARFRDEAARAADPRSRRRRRRARGRDRRGRRAGRLPPALWAERPALDRGKGEDDRWLALDVPAKLVRAGARVAISGNSPRDLLFAARLASRGGLDSVAALRAITLAPAEILGVARRVGSLREGKDADLCVLNGDPLSPGTSVLATWIEGEVVWKAPRPKDPAAAPATVIEVDELHVGDGRILRPGQLLMQDGRIREVGERVSHPRGASVVHGHACMPGMIDAFGHLGLEGSRKVPSTDYDLATIVEPGDATDRRVALEGITTVVLTPRGASDTGAPVMAYKPAAREFARQVVGDPTALRLRWDDPVRLRSGQNVRQLLEKAKEYRAKWIEYEQAMAKWTPPAETAAAAEGGEKAEKKEGETKAGETKEGEKGEKKDEKAATETKPEEKKEEGDKVEKKDDAKSKKKKKDQPEELEPDPITGLWQAELAATDSMPKTMLKVRLQLAKPGESAAVEGNLRCDAASSTLVEITGWFEREKRSLAISGIGSQGRLELTGELKEGKLAAKLLVAGKTLEATLERASKEYVVAKRTERGTTKTETPKEPKGKPREPKRDEKLEPLRRAMDGKAAVVIEVNRALDIVACVGACAEAGVPPILYGAAEAHLVLDQIADKIAGVLLAPTVIVSDPKRGTDFRTPYADFQNAGVRVAFQSEAEEGAIDLPLRAAFAVANGMSPEGALRALTADAAAMMTIDARVGRLASGLDADVLLLDGPPLDPTTSVLRTWVNGEEVEAP